LSLLATSLAPLDSPDQRARFLAHVTQTDRYLFDYLAEEVLDQQDPFTRSFLLETAILPELIPHICEALTGRADTPIILDQLYRRNLFLVKIQADTPLGNDQAAYRYHDLFRAFLLERLRREAPEWLQALHRRAAACVGDPLRAIDHLCHAELWDTAADQIEAIAESLLAQGAHHTLQTLIDALPEATRVARPRLRYLLGICIWQHWDSRAAAELLVGAANDFARLGDTISQGNALVFLSTALGHAGELGRARDAAEQALLLPLAPVRRVQLLAGRSWQNLVGGEWPQAAADLDEALAIVERTRDAQACTALMVALKGSLMSLPGAIARIARLSRLITALVPQQQRELHAATAVMRAWAAIWLDDWATADAERQIAINSLLPSDTFSNIHAEIHMQQPVCAAILGHLRQADDAIVRLLADLEPQGGLLRTGRLISFLHMIARVRWLQGRDADLHAIYGRMRDALLSSVWLSDAPLCREIGALVHLVEGRHEAAITDLGIVAEDQTRLMVAPILGDPRLYLAHAYLQAGHPDRAADVARPALTAIRRENAPGRLRWQGPMIVIPILHLFVEDASLAAFATAALARLEA
jgi:LuxR family maltose regulon positive regulatory protein